MIITLRSTVNAEQAETLARTHQAFCVKHEEGWLLVTASSLRTLPATLETFTEKAQVFTDDIQLASRSFLPQTREIRCGALRFGGQASQTVLMAGPCSAESETQLEEIAGMLKALGLSIIRAGCFKPRTSPYTFQGLGEKGLQMLARIRDTHGLKVVTEVRDATHIEQVIEYADIIQVGAKAMYDQGILRRLAKTDKPVLLKRGFGATLQEFVQSAEFILSGGNPNVMLCERGIRSFETRTRFTLDLCGAVWLKQHCNLPLVLDPSHAMGYAYGVPDLARACMALGVDGLLIEVHPQPAQALSDAAQQIEPSQFRELVASLHPIAQALNRKIS